MPKAQNHYEKLNIPRDAHPDAIRAAFKSLAQKYHPDKNPGELDAAGMMKAINIAYVTLSDPITRRQHDQWLAQVETISIGKTRAYSNCSQNQNGTAFTMGGARSFDQGQSKASPLSKNNTNKESSKIGHIRYHWYWYLIILIFLSGIYVNNHTNIPLITPEIESTQLSEHSIEVSNLTQGSFASKIKATPSLQGLPSTNQTLISAVKPNSGMVFHELFGTTDIMEKVKVGSNKLASIWFEQSFVNENDQIYVVFVKEQTLDEKGQLISCNTCGVDIDAVTYKEVADGWIELSKQRNIAILGSGGDAPANNEGTLIRQQGEVLHFAHGNTELLVNDRFVGQETRIDFKHILEYHQQEWFYIGNINVSGNGGDLFSCINPEKQSTARTKHCWSYTGDIATEPSNNPDYPNLVVEHTYTNFSRRESVVPAVRAIYKFDGKKYLERAELVLKR